MRSSRARMLRQATAVLALFAISANLHGQTTPATTPDSSEPSEDIVTLEKQVIKEMREFADQAIPGKTPVSFSEIGKELIASQLGSRDIPLMLNNTPSVYATADGGGAGDARINVRGFSQRNVSILINGVPTNDIENGWLYWSNWDGLGDVTSTIQMQRGLSNVTLPTPSIGGTMNIITDPASSRSGGSFKFEVGSDDFYKATAVYSTGMLADKFAVTAGLVGKYGQGYALGTWTKGMGYYLGATWKVNKKNRLEFFLVGAPQEHGQRRFASNIAAYDVGYARELGYTEAQIYGSGGATAQGPINSGLDFNPNYAPVSKSYSGQQYYWGKLHNREKDGYLNESVNYFHKPQANVNWYLTITDDLKLTSVFYYSGGRGGGSGTLNNGSSSNAFARYANSDPEYGSNINWDGTIASNRGAVHARGGAKTPGQSLGILRNSVNNQDQFGAVSKLSYEVTPEVKVTAGLDWRTAEIDHFREVRDLLGGDYYLPTAAQASEFWSAGTSTRLGLGDKVDYFNTNTVDWLGLFAQGQYENGPFTAFGIYGYSTIKYAYVDHFRRASAGSSEEYRLAPPSMDGHQIKGGVNYAITAGFSAFLNAGWVSKAPVYDGVINDSSGLLVPGSENERFTSIETGVRYVTADKKLNASASFYRTLWKNRTISFTDTRITPNEQYYFYGSNLTFSGVEIDGAWKPKKWIRFDGALSHGRWTYDNDVRGEVYVSGSPTLLRSGTAYLAGIKVGDAPQTQVAYSVTAYPVSGLSVEVQGRSYSRYWAEFEPGSRFNSSDRAQPWKIPAYTVFDLHVNYNLPLHGKRLKIGLFAHVFNVLNKTYISDATEESQFEAVSLNLAARHTAQRAEVFFGMPISFNTGLKLSF